MLAAAACLAGVLHAQSKVTATPHLTELLAGNDRYVKGLAVHPHQDQVRRLDQSKGQAPKTIILGCADSRVPPEIIFDQGLGDLFVVRAAGNVADGYAMASLEYAVEHLGATHLMVLGHEKCGALKAAVESFKPAKEAHHAGGHEPEAAFIGSLVKRLVPSVKEAKSLTGDLLSNSIEVNARRSMQSVLSQSAFIRHRASTGQLGVSCAIYDLDSGRVRVSPAPKVSGKAAEKSHVKIHGKGH